MKKFTFLAVMAFIFSVLLKSQTQTIQTLSTFENSYENLALENGDWCVSERFTANGQPGIYNNPLKVGINISNKCFGAVNVADADWWGSIVSLKLSSPITIPQNGDVSLQMKVYRSIQPKNFRIGINGHEAANEVFQGKLNSNAIWEQIKLDLESKRGTTINSINIVFSCNWSEPRTGWGEAAYYFDDIEFVSSSSILPGIVVIDASKAYQTIDGFSASDCWMGNYVGRYWTEEAKARIAKSLFSQQTDASGNPQGIGLSMWRVNLGAGTEEQGTGSGISEESRRAQSFLNSNSEYDWTKQAGQQYFFRKAKEYGCEHLVAFSNSPLVQYTRNGKGYGDGSTNANLKDDKYDDFADYMATVLKHFKDEGLPFSFISPVNEPQYKWEDGGQEGSPWSNASIKKLVVELDKSIQTKELDTKILLSEACQWDYLSGKSGGASNQIYEFFDSKSVNYIGNLNSIIPVIGGHSYWTHNNNSQLKTIRTAVKQSADNYNLKLYQTEWSMLGDAPQNAGFPSNYSDASYMDIALFMAKVIHADLTFAGVSSWSYWTSMDLERWDHKNRFLLIAVEPKGGVYGSITAAGSNIVRERANLWALGNYSFFIRPGYQRVDLTGASDLNGLMGSAYLSPDRSKLVVVYVNMGNSDSDVTMSVNNQNRSLLSVDKYITSADLNLKKDNSQSISITGNQVISIPKRSVTTIVYSYGSLSNVENIDKETNKVSVHPNPVKAGEVLKFSSPEQNLTNNYKVSLYTLSGQLILNQTNSANGSIKIPEQLSKGTYLFVIEGKQSSIRQKISIE